jgi:hypothetical protein
MDTGSVVVVALAAAANALLGVGAVHFLSGWRSLVLGSTPTSTACLD